MAILFCFAACKNSSSDSGDDYKNDGTTPGGNSQTTPDDTSNSGDSQGWQYSIGYSLGTPPEESKRTDKFEIVNDSEGIYLKFDYPESKDYWRTTVYIEGLGTIAEEVQDLDTTKMKGCFFYPFVNAGKEYTIRFVSFANEKKDENGFVINGEIVLGWFETKVTAGANSKGEVRFTSKGEIFVDKKGNFKFTKKSTFQNEHLLGNNWMVEIGLVEGISWAHGDERKTDWHGSIQIPQADLLKQINFFEELPWLPGIDFICVRPIMYYEHNGKSYRYQWEGFVKDIFYPPKADSLETIDISNPSQVSKICGTWKYNTYWTDDNYWIYDSVSVVPIEVKQTKILTIDAQNLEIKIVEVLTKKDGSEFTEEEKNYHLENTYRHTTISDDNKKMTQEWLERDTLSEYLEGWRDDDYTRHYELKLFEDTNLGNELRVIGSGKDNGQDYEFCDTYKKQ